MAAGDVDERRGASPSGGRLARRLHVACVALVGLCSVAVVTAGRADDPVVRSQPAPSWAAAFRMLDRVPVRAGPPVRLGGVPTTDDRPAAVATSAPRAVAAPVLLPPPSPPPPTSARPAPTTTAPPPPPVAAVAARPVPPPEPPTPPAGPPAFSTTITAAGHVATDVGCAAGTSAGALDEFFRHRIGPVLGHDYQHVVALGGDRALWLFQDTFLDHTGAADHLDEASFAHNTALVQQGRCFTLLHGGTPAAPRSFEPGTGDRILDRWFWPLGGETSGGEVGVFWVEMRKTADPRPPDGLGWIPVATWLATYDAGTLARRSFRPAPAAGVTPIYGYAVASDAEHTYLFGNSFDQNLARQGGYHACPCSATAMYLARVPRGELAAAPEYRTAAGWSPDPSAAVPIVRRHHAENPMQPRFVDGRWVAVTKVDGYWGDDLTVDVAPRPEGPWVTVSRRPLPPRGGDPLMNTYHAHLLPGTADGLVISVSQNARDMRRDAWARPDRYRLQFLAAAMPPRPLDPAAGTTTTTAPSSTATTIITATTTTTTVAPTTAASTTTTTVPPTTVGPSTSAAPTTLAPTTTSTSTTTTDAPACATTTTTTTSSAGSTSSSTTTSSAPPGC